MRDFVVRCVAQSDLTSYPAAHRTLRAVTKLALFCVDRNVDLDVERVLHPDRVDEFLAIELADSRSASDYRSDLRRLGPRVTRSAPWIPQPKYPPRDRCAPYSDGEVRALRRAVETQSTKTRRQAGRALLLLGLGVGADGRHVRDVKPDDVFRLGDNTLVVRLPGREPRLVPVASDLADELEEFALSVSSECLVGRASAASNRAGSLVRQIQVPGGPELQLRRLRTTWLVALLASGCPLPHALTAAGFVSTGRIDGLLQYVADRVESAHWMTVEA